MEYYSAIKRNEIMPFGAVSLDLESVIQMADCHREKNKYCISQFTHSYVSDSL